MCSKYLNLASSVVAASHTASHGLLSVQMRSKSTTYNRPSIPNNMLRWHSVCWLVWTASWRLIFMPFSFARFVYVSRSIWNSWSFWQMRRRRHRKEQKKNGTTTKIPLEIKLVVLSPSGFAQWSPETECILYTVFYCIKWNWSFTSNYASNENALEIKWTVSTQKSKSRSQCSNKYIKNYYIHFLFQCKFSALCCVSFVLGWIFRCCCCCVHHTLEHCVWMSVCTSY